MMTTGTSAMEEFQHSVEQFFASVSWVYLTHRYPLEAQGLLLRVLTLSGLEPACWAHCISHLIAHPQSHLAQCLMQAPENVTDREIRSAVGEIYEYAEGVGASVGKPPRFPLYLLSYGYTHEAYVRDVCRLCGPLVARLYVRPWPIAVLAPHNMHPTDDRATEFKRSFAIMGATAGAIERLVTLGGYDGTKQ